VRDRRKYLTLFVLILAALAGALMLEVPGSPIHRNATLGLDLPGLQRAPPDRQAQGHAQQIGVGELLPRPGGAVVVDGGFAGAGAHDGNHEDKKSDRRKTRPLAAGGMTGPLRRLVRWLGRGRSPRSSRRPL